MNFKYNKIIMLIKTIIMGIMIFLIIFPVFIMINTSLKTYNEILMWPPKWCQNNLHFENYKNIIIGEKSIVNPMLNSVIISSGTMILCITIGILAVYGVTRFNFKGKTEFLFVIIITQMFSSVILVNPMYIIFRNFNLLDTKLALILSNTATCLPMTIWLLHSYMSKIPLSLEEASMVDGCDRLMSIKKILIPLMYPGIISAGLFAFIVSWGDLVYANAFVLSENQRTISMALTNFQSLYKTTWETQMAASVLSTVPVFVMFIFIQKYLCNNIFSGGVKG